MRVGVPDPDAGPVSQPMTNAQYDAAVGASRECEAVGRRYSRYTVVPCKLVGNQIVVRRYGYVILENCIPSTVQYKSSIHHEL